MRNQNDLTEISLRELIRKYDCAGPRYTSYPPAPVFSPEFGSTEFQKAIVETEKNTHNENLSLYVHIPFCDTLCYFCGCTTFVTRNHEHVQEYLLRLKKEIDLLAEHAGTHRRVVQLHWGGGTPTYLTPGQIEELGSYLREKFQYSSDAEVSVEVDPRGLSYQHLAALRNVGFNRMSLGVQDFNVVVQVAVNRLQSESLTRQVVDWGRELGFSSLNIDLIYGLPQQTSRSFAETLDRVIDISPDRLAVYNFAYVPWMKKHQRLISRESLPSPDTKVSILTSTIQTLQQSGYEYIGMDHFAKTGDELARARYDGTLHRNFQGYSTKAGSDLYGLGLSSISHFGTYYAQNAKVLSDYYEAIDGSRFATKVGYVMTFDDEVRKHVIMRLMCNVRLDVKDVERKFGIAFHDYFVQALGKLRPLADDGLVQLTDDSIIVTDLGRMFLRNIAMCFDAHAYVGQGAQPVYSRTV